MINLRGWPFVLALVGACGGGGSNVKADDPMTTPTTPTTTPPPTSPRAQEIQTLVDNAAALVESQGKDAAFAEFRKRDSAWWHGETYLFAYDMQLNVLLNPAFPQREGTNPSGQKDANGKAFHDEFAHVVKTAGAGWVDYRFPRPGQTEVSQKWSYVKGVRADGALVMIIGAGFYE